MTRPADLPAFSVPPDVAWCDLEGGVVIQREGWYLSLNPTASFLWGLLLDGLAAAAMVTCLQEDAAVAPAAAARDVGWFLGTLADHGVITTRAGGAHDG